MSAGRTSGCCSRHSGEGLRAVVGEEPGLHVHEPERLARVVVLRKDRLPGVCLGIVEDTEDGSIVAVDVRLVADRAAELVDVGDATAGASKLDDAPFALRLHRRVAAGAGALDARGRPGAEDAVEAVGGAIVPRGVERLAFASEGLLTLERRGAERLALAHAHGGERKGDGHQGDHASHGVSQGVLLSYRCRGVFVATVSVADSITNFFFCQ